MRATTAGEHVSDALRHLRSGVTLCCWLAGLAFLVQITTWTLISTTDLRHHTLHMPDSEMPAVVVDSTGRPSAEPIVKQGTFSQAGHSPVQPMQGDQSTGSAEVRAATVSAEPDLNVILSPFDRWFAYAHQLAFVVGLCAIVVLFVQSTVGIAVGAASGLTGVSRLVSCQSWSIVLVVLSIPWGSMVTDMAYPGMFSAYADMASDAERMASETGESVSTLMTVMHFGRFLLLPATGIGIVWMAACAFHSGAAGGIIRRKRSQLDLILEEEQDPDRKPAGATSNLVSGGRAFGAFKQHVGPDTSEATSAPSGRTGVGLLKPRSFSTLKTKAAGQSGEDGGLSGRDHERSLLPDEKTEELEAAGAAGSTPRRPI